MKFQGIVKFLVRTVVRLPHTFNAPRDIKTINKQQNENDKNQKAQRTRTTLDKIRI